MSENISSCRQFNQVIVSRGIKLDSFFVQDFFILPIFFSGKLEAEFLP